MMYVQCMYNAVVQQLTDMVYASIEKHRHIYTCIYISANVHTTRTSMYMVCTFQVINVYVLCSDVHVHVYTIMYMF
jgi:hypothetical protein